MVQQTVCLKTDVRTLNVMSNIFILPTDFPLGTLEKLSEVIPCIVT